MWMLSPALIRAWTSVVLLDPGITISVGLEKILIMKVHSDQRASASHTYGTGTFEM